MLLSSSLLLLIVSNVYNNILFTQGVTSQSAISSSLSSFQDITCSPCETDDNCGGDYMCKDFSFYGNTIKVCVINECDSNSECNNGEYCWKQRCCGEDTIDYDVTSSICVVDVCEDNDIIIIEPSETLPSDIDSFIINGTYNATYYDDAICGIDNVTYSSELNLLCHDTCIFHVGECSTKYFGFSTTSYDFFSTTEVIEPPWVKKFINYFVRYLLYSIGVVVLVFICCIGFAFCCCRFCCCRNRRGQTTQANPMKANGDYWNYVTNV